MYLGMIDMTTPLNKGKEFEPLTKAQWYGYVTIMLLIVALYIVHGILSLGAV